ncbi:guanine nucleotide-binding protein alpha-4 subunit, partial [Mycena alexandri]
NARYERKSYRASVWRDYLFSCFSCSKTKRPQPCFLRRLCFLCLEHFNQVQLQVMHTSDDPLDAVLRPPPDETAEQAAVREARETEARRVSAAIDADIKAERQARRKKRIVRLLLLGQSESGKSTTLRQFQRLYTPTAFREERILWRAVIQLNVVRSIRTILDALEPPNSYSPSSRAPSRPRTRRPSAASASMLALAASPASPYPNTAHAGPSSPSYGGADPYDAGYESAGRYASPGVDSDVESDPGGADFGGTSVPVFRNGVGDYGAGPSGALAYHHQLQQQAQAQSQSRFANAPPPIPNGVRSSSPPGANGFQGGSGNTITLDALKLALFPLRHVEARLVPTAAGEEEPTYLPRSTLASTSTGEIFLFFSLGRGQPAMHALWADPGVREVLRSRKVRVEEEPGFFLDDLERVTSPNYLPTDDDVLRARLKTVGVSEYTFEMEVSTGRETGTEWRIVDVGGSRSQVPTWVPFFDDVDAIIFLAPIAGFDQVLAEDKTEDSVLLWKAVCSNKLLAGVDLVLFLNKCDIFGKKLEGGVRLVRYVRSYADRENTFEAVSQYLQSKFSAIHREYSPNPRKCYVFLTSVTDTATTGGIIASVRDMVVRQHLKQSKLL